MTQIISLLSRKRRFPSRSVCWCSASALVSQTFLGSAPSPLSRLGPPPLHAADRCPPVPSGSFTMRSLGPTLTLACADSFGRSSAAPTTLSSSTCPSLWSSCPPCSDFTLFTMLFSLSASSWPSLSLLAPLLPPRCHQPWLAPSALLTPTLAASYPSQPAGLMKMASTKSASSPCESQPTCCLTKVS